MAERFRAPRLRVDHRVLPARAVQVAFPDLGPRCRVRELALYVLRVSAEGTLAPCPFLLRSKGETSHEGGCPWRYRVEPQLLELGGGK